MKKGFTLAEVLITLGIIGVVTALTLPLLTAKYEKVVTVARLKKDYAILSNALERAKADKGDIINWGLADLDFTEYKGGSELRNIIYPFIETYIAPYVQKVRFEKEVTFSSLGYNEDIKYRNGSVYAPKTATISVLIFNDGSLIFPQAAEKNGVIGPNGGKLIGGFRFVIDINGSQKPNMIGKDIFFTLVPLTVNSRLFFSHAYYTTNSTYRIDPDFNRTEALKDCKDTGFACGWLIQQDGWQIKEDYGW